MRALIITADDFGLDPAVNAAVAQAHEHGVLSAASLMMGGPALLDAVAIAKRLPSLAVGLHIAVVQAWPVSAPQDIPALVDRDGRLPEGLLMPSIAWALSSSARRDLEREVAAQFEAFAATGLPLDHVTVHNHLHLHPLLADVIIAQAVRHGRPPIRLPREPWELSNTPGAPADQRFMAQAMARGCRMLEGRLERARLTHNDWIGGIAHSGRLDEAALLGLIAALPAAGTGELHAHPATVMTPAVQAAWPGYDGPAELRALTSPAVRAALAAADVRLVGFRAALAGAMAAGS